MFWSENLSSQLKNELLVEFFIYSFLGGKLASLEEFKVHREELMAKFANMEKELEQKDEDHKSAIYDLEKKAVLDKSRLVTLFREHWSKTSFQFFLFFNVLLKKWI